MIYQLGILLPYDHIGMMAHSVHTLTQEKKKNLSLKMYPEKIITALGWGEQGFSQGYVPGITKENVRAFSPGKSP